MMVQNKSEGEIEPLKRRWRGKQDNLWSDGDEWDDDENLRGGSESERDKASERAATSRGKGIFEESEETLLTQNSEMEDYL